MLSPAVLLALVIGLLGIASFFFVFARRKDASATEATSKFAAPSRTGGGFSPQPQVSAAALRGAAGVEDAAEEEDLADGNGEAAAEDINDDAGGGALVPAPGAKPSASRFQRKKADKQQAKEERKAAMTQHLEDVRAKRSAELQAAVDAEAAEAILLAKEEAALAELRAEKRQREEEDYKKWIGHIEVAEKGEIGAADAVEQSLRTYLMETAPVESKLLVLEDAARRHAVSVEKLVKILNEMLASGSISGVFDDRGKFVFVTDAEYDAISKFIRNRGRVSVTELVRECNRIVAA
jgi:hypothetical protein